MFKLRLLSTVLLLPVAIAGILYLPSLYIAVISGIIFAMAAWEWLYMAISNTFQIRLMLLVSLIFIAISFFSVNINAMWPYYVALIWWLCAFVSICYYPRYAQLWKQTSVQPIICLIMFVPAWLAFNTLYHQFKPVWVLLGCALVWGSDIGAYCFGKLWGKSKLAPKVSPGKTWAGLCGAYISGMIIMLLFYVLLQPMFSVFAALCLAIATISFAVVGDLFESMLKRIYGFKDSGNIIPGHGGVYDRIDSLLAAFPVYFLGLCIVHNVYAV